MKKKIILLNISKSIAEIDWILPVLYELKSKFKIVTIFQKYEIYESLLKNKNLFFLWKKISYQYFIDNKKNKLFRFFAKKFNIKYDLKKKFQMMKINFSEVKIILSEFGTYCWLFDEIKKIDNKKITIYFPTSSFIFGIEKKNQKIKYRLNGDYLLLCNKLDINFWQKRIEKNKIKIVGVPKYDKHWIKKILKKSKTSIKPKILFTYSSRFNLKGVNKYKLKDQLIKIMEVLDNFTNYKVIIKAHPRKNDSYYLNILNKFKKIDWKISNENILTLANKCNLLIHEKHSSVIYEGLAVNKPCIEYWDIENYDRTIQAHDYLKINVTANDQNQLFNLIKMAIKNPKSRIWLRQQANFKKNLEQFTISCSKYASDTICNIYEKNI
jgi:hypothetical protein